MVDIKLVRLPDRTPVKIAIAAMPELAESLAAYAGLYREAYHLDASVSELIPAMLTAFLESDRVFVRVRSSERKVDNSK